jgi:hypothetical protein
MTYLEKLNLTTYSRTAQNPVAAKRRKLADKIEVQLAMARDSEYQPTKVMWRKDSEGRQQRVTVPKRVKRWWSEQADGTVLLTVRYGSRAMELARGKNAIELKSSAQLVQTLEDLKAAAMAGEFDAHLAQMVGFGRRLKREKKAQ